MLQKPATASDWCLEAHLMRELSLGKREASLKVLPQHCAISVTLDRLQDLSINCCLVSLPLLRGLVSLLLGLKDVSFLLRFLSLHPGEVLVVDVLRHRHLGDVELCGGGHQVPLVHPPEWAAVELVGSSNKEQACAVTKYDEKSGKVTLVIENLGPGDEGQYECRADNPYGDSTCTIAITPEVTQRSIVLPKHSCRPKLKACHIDSDDYADYAALQGL